MNSSAQNKNGFTTFLATLVISLAVFGVLYYLITDFSGKVSIEEAPDVSKTEVASAEDKSVFGELSRQKVETPQRSVLAGADMVEVESTESTTTVPETGSNGMAIEAVIASTTLVAGSCYIIRGPRKLALNKFEKELIE